MASTVPIRLPVNSLLDEISISKILQIYNIKSIMLLHILVIEHHPMFTDDNVLGVNVNMAELKHIM